MQTKDATILIVEDEPALREIMSAWVKRGASKVLMASNGVEALEVLAANRADVVISDIRMPMMDGITLLKKIRAAGLDSPSFILISGFSDLEPRDAYDLGADAILQKPMERQDVFDAVQRSLMTRDQLWQTPADDMPTAALEVSYPSLAAALQEQKLAFGRGGFCIVTAQKLHEGPVTVRLEFKGDRQQLEGSGMVRWNALAERLAGIELLHLSPEGRTWLVKLIEQIDVPSFIPASTAQRHTLSVKSA